jgi:hypothetical protein
VAEFSGLAIIAAYAYSTTCTGTPAEVTKCVQTAVNGALQGLFYLALVLIALAVLLMIRFFVIGRRKERAAAGAIQELKNGPR